MAYDTDTWTAKRLELEKKSAKAGGIVLSDETAAIMVVARNLSHIDSTLEAILREIGKDDSELYPEED